MDEQLLNENTAQPAVSLEKASASQQTQPRFTQPVQPQFTQPVQQQYAPPAQQQYAPVSPQYAPPAQQYRPASPQYAQPMQQQHRPVSPQYAPPMQQQYRPVSPQYAPQYAPPYAYGAPASVRGTANAYPMYTYQKTPKEIERDGIQSAAGKGGVLCIAVTIAMFVIALIFGVSMFFMGTFTMETTDGDPYMGFTPIGFYTFEGLSSLLSLFIPATIMLFSVKNKEKLRYKDILPFEKLGGKKLAAVVFAGLSVCMIAQLMSAILSFNFSIFGFDVEEFLGMELGTSPLDILMNVICTALIPALVEEFAFRGVVLGTLKKYDTNLAIVGSAFLFGMLHGNLGQIPFAFVVGLVLAYVRVKCDSMLPNILIHFGNNFYAVILMTVSEVAPDQVTSVVDAAFVVLLIAAGFISFYWLTKTDKDFFIIPAQKSYLTFGEKVKAFFSSGAVIASTVLLCLETVAVLNLI